MHGPPPHHTTGPPADRGEDDVTLLLRCGEPEGRRRCPPRRTIRTVAQDSACRVKDARDEVRALPDGERRLAAAECV